MCTSMIVQSKVQLIKGPWSTTGLPPPLPQRGTSERSLLDVLANELTDLSELSRLGGGGGGGGAHSHTHTSTKQTHTK